MSCKAIWLDRREAKLFSFEFQNSNPAGTKKVLRSELGFESGHVPDEFALRRERRRFFSEICDELVGTDQLILMGPGMARYHFYNYLVEHQPFLAKTVLACETVDHLSDPQIAAFVRKIYEASMVVPVT